MEPLEYRNPMHELERAGDDIWTRPIRPKALFKPIGKTAVVLLGILVLLATLREAAHGHFW